MKPFKNLLIGTMTALVLIFTAGNSFAQTSKTNVKTQVKAKQKASTAKAQKAIAKVKTDDIPNLVGYRENYTTQGMKTSTPKAEEIKEVPVKRNPFTKKIKTKTKEIEISGEGHNNTWPE